MNKINEKKLALIKKIDEAWSQKRNLFGIEYDINKGYFSYRNAVLRLDLC